jgi:putative CGCGG family rSAM target protein
MTDSEPARGIEHEGSWSANLETDRHADDRSLVVEEAREAVRSTAAGVHVNLVTHGDHGDPREYLWESLASLDRVTEVEYVDRCGCGGYVTRVHVA